ncbi:SDR family NAD(P)-dependent oxidoreductase [Streptodolium elevatio]|uniref:SDR family oxidoreductase n=1 Tax=Streptodolium elevatio TaxID=3157996 RepID=A0ABV3DL20_9ACTN
MQLKNKNAVVYGAGGAIGGAVARAYAREGARLFLAGRTSAKVEAVARQIVADGGRAEAAEVDALDKASVDAHAAHVAASGSLDISFNAIGVHHVQGASLLSLATGDFLLPITTYSTTQFLTTTAAARHMKAQRSGVILTLSTTAARMSLPSNGFGPACAAVEALSRQLAGELASYGVRVVCLRPDGMPETVAYGSHAGEVWEHAAERMAEMAGTRADIDPGGPGALLGRPVTLAEVAATAVFLASPGAGGMTGTVTSVTAGSLLD